MSFLKKSTENNSSNTRPTPLGKSYSYSVEKMDGTNSGPRRTVSTTALTMNNENSKWQPSKATTSSDKRPFLSDKREFTDDLNSEIERLRAINKLLENQLADLYPQLTCTEHVEIIKQLYKQVNQLQEENRQQAQTIKDLSSQSPSQSSTNPRASISPTNSSTSLMSLKQASSASPSSSSEQLPGLSHSESTDLPMEVATNVNAPAPANPTRPPSKPMLMVTLTVRAPDLTLTTSVNLDWTIKETIAKLKRKFPGDTTNYCLLLKTGRTTFMQLDSEKQVKDYEKQIQDAKGILDFQRSTQFEAKGGQLVKKSSTLREKKTVSSSIFHQLIAQKDIQKLESFLLDNEIKHDLTQLNEEGITPIHAAIRSADTRIVSLFVNYGKRMNVDFNLKDKYGWSAMHYAVATGTGTDADDEIFQLISSYPNIFVDSENDDGNTPLHYFAQKFLNPSCSQLGLMLIKKAPATVNKRNKNGETPLHKAIFNQTVRVLMVKLLTSCGADVNVQNAQGGETALHYSVRLKRKDLVKILLQHGADASKESKDKLTPYNLALQSNLQEIADILKSFTDLQQWLASLQLEEHFKSFLKEDLYLETLVSVSPETLDSILDALKMDSVGMRLKFKNAVVKLKDDYSKKDFENRLQKVQKNKVALPSANTEQVAKLKLGLSALSDKGGENWEIQHRDMEFTKELGTGTSGKVFKGLFQGKKVAIKVFKAVDSNTLDGFKKEFHIMSIVRSPFLIHFFGACLEPKICMVMEYCSRGSLYDVLKSPGLVLGWDLGWKFASEMFEAMKAIHTWTPQILHRDMKSLNLLITRDWQVKLADFGLSRFNTSENMKTMTKMCGTYHYLAPELFYAKPYSEKADIFSCGVVLWEICYRIKNAKYAPPYHEYNIKIDFQIPYQVAEKGIRPTIPKDIPESWEQLIKQCLAKEPDQRPTSTQAIEFLEAQKQAITSSQPTTSVERDKT